MLRPAACVAIAAAAIAVYAASAGYGLFADDFQWLVAAQQFQPSRLVDLGDRAHFYRPVIEVYFPSAFAVCGRDASCYHWLSILLHAATSLLVTGMAAALARHFWTGAFAGLLFAIQPGPMEAVIWVSAVTEVLSTAFFVLAVWLFVRALETGARLSYAGAFVSAVACHLTHESGLMLLPVLAVLVWLHRGPDSAVVRRHLMMLAPFSVITTAVAATAVVVNSRNYVVTDGEYGIGWHMLRNELDAVATFTIASHDAVGLIFAAVLIAFALVAGPPRVRFYGLWIIATLLPFSGFREGFSSRYLYLAAAGFAALGAELFWWLRQSLAHKSRYGLALWWVAVVVLTARFAVFANKNVRTWDDAGAPYSQYGARVRGLYPSATPGMTLDVPPPPKEISPHYLPAFLQWEYGDISLRIRARGEAPAVD